MLNGIAPIIIFNFKKVIQQVNTSSVPLVSNLTETIPLVPIPIYLDERLTGIYIDRQGKNIDIKTDPETTPDGKANKPVQTPVNSVVSVQMLASTTSVGLNVLIALCDLVFPKLTSQEYSITYINGPMTVFNGLLEAFSVENDSDNTLFRINLQISNAGAKSTKDEASTGGTPVPKVTGLTPL